MRLAASQPVEFTPRDFHVASLDALVVGRQWPTSTRRYSDNGRQELAVITTVCRRLMLDRAPSGSGVPMGACAAKGEFLLISCRDYMRAFLRANCAGHARTH